MKKRLLTILLIFCMVLTMVPVGGVFAASTDITVDDITYRLNDDGTTATVIANASGTYSGNIEIPSSFTDDNNVYTVIEIDGSAFASCTSLTSLTIPASVTNIADAAFKGCSGLKEINVDGNNPNYSSADGVLFNKDKTTLITCPAGKTGEYKVPDSVWGIGGYAFYNCEKLTSITIPAGVGSIGVYAFAGCTGLTSITIPASVTAIYEYAFCACEKLTSITFEAGSKLTSIGNNAFNTCKSLTSIIIPNSVTSIGERAFSGCEGLTSIEIPKSVISIGEQAFLACTGLTAIKVDGNNPSYSSADGVLFNKDKTTLIKYPIGKRDTSYKIPDSVTDIGERAFENCTGLTSITIPNSVTTIEGSVFSGCTGLTSITIPNSVTSIGDRAFSGCTGLTSITIPDSITTIETYTFFVCTNLTSIAIPASVETIADDAFNGCNDSLTALIYGGTAEDRSKLKSELPSGITPIFLKTKPEFEVNHITSTSVTLNEITGDTDNPSEPLIVKYRVKDDDITKGWKEGKEGTEFTRLNPDTEYTFQVGFFEKNTVTTPTTPKAKAVYELAPVKTLDTDRELEAEDITYNSITLKELASLGSGITAQYRMKDGTWDTNLKFEGLASGTTYTFEAKYFVGNKEITDVITADIKTRTPYTPPANPTIDITGKEGGTVIYDRIKHTVTITPNDDYLVKEISLNGTTIPVTDGAMVLENIYGWSRISVTFEPKPEPAFEPDKYISKLKFKANSSKTSKGNIRIKVTFVTDDNGNKIDLTELKDKGYTVKFKYYRSTKKASKYTAKVEKSADINSYINTSGKKGTKYYYKVRVMVYDADGNLVAKSDLKQCSYAARTWSK